MSVEIKQSSPGSPLSSKESNCAPITSLVRPEDMNSTFKEELERALGERDEMWRKHEKQQIAYLQDQNSQMLSRLHVEIERLQNANRDLERRLYVSTEPETNELRDELNQAQLANDKLKKELAGSENRSRLLAVNLEESAKLYKNQVTEHESRIRTLSTELDHRTLTITQLSTQLRNFKLREAMAQAQQRRRASCIEPSKHQQISPTAPKNTGFRLFAGSTSSASSTVTPTERIRVNVPGNGSVLKQNASVSVSYPAAPVYNRRLPFIGSLQRSSTTENSIEKPAITRSLSGNILPTKPHLLHALRNVQEITSTEDSV